MSTKFDMRSDENVIRNYGRMLVDLAAAIPDGIVCFFVSYSYMDSIVSRWNDMGILKARALRALHGCRAGAGPLRLVAGRSGVSAVVCVFVFIERGGRIYSSSMLVPVPCLRTSPHSDQRRTGPGGDKTR